MTFSPRSALAPRSPRPLLFDLDGTLTDPREGIVGSIRHALEALGVASPSDARLERCIGPPLATAFSELLETRDQAAIDRAVTLYRERFGEHGLYENVVYPGIDESLAALRRAGHPLFVVSSKPRVYVERIVEHFALRAHFEGLYGSELDGTRSDKVELIAWVLEVEGFGHAAPIMVGDRHHDVIGARRNGLTAVGVGWGYGSRDELGRAGADVVLDHPRELFGALTGSGAFRTAGESGHAEPGRPGEPG